jgi:hypothetical protein
MFLLTWGRQQGLDNEDFFPDSPKMQRYLNIGYRAYQQAAYNPRTFVAPAGIAYLLIYAKNSRAFRDLYGSDGSRPTVDPSLTPSAIPPAATSAVKVHPRLSLWYSN